MPRFVLLVLVLLSLCARVAAQPALPNIVLIGYWPPSNEMLRAFSTNAAQNPSGWAGANWEGRGFNVRAFFPEFPANGPCGGVGDFRVDYQGTSADFERVTAELHPVAIISFSVGASANGWGLEPAYQRWRLPNEHCTPGSRRLPTYLPDCSGDRYPIHTPIAAEPIGHIRLSNLPMQAIVSAVGAQVPGPNIAPFVYPYQSQSSAIGAFGGNFLSGYLPYLGAWYRDNHPPVTSSAPCFITGHIHVGNHLTQDIGRQAVEATLRTVMASLDPMVADATLAGGACCDPMAGTCQFTVASACGATFLGNFTACLSNACPAPIIGACCLIDGTCTITPNWDCDDGPRTWTAGGVCEPNPCPPAPVGICCRGATCNALIGPGRCAAGDGAAGAVFVVGGSVCNPNADHTQPCCYADYNKLGGVTVQDIFDFLSDWMGGSPLAIVGGDGETGTLSAMDIFAFLSDWFAGCH